MTRHPFFRRTLRITRFRTDVPRDVSDEIEVYLEMRAQELVDEGLEPEDARRAAAAAFGDRRRIELECRRIAEPWSRRRRWAEALGSWLTDVRHAGRDFRRRPVFAAMACLTLAVCVALNAAVFSVVHAIVWRPLPFEGPDRIMTVFNSYPKAGSPRVSNSAPDYLDRRRGVAAFEEVALYQSRTHTLGEPGALRRSFSMTVTPSFFRLLGVEPFLGRTFTDEESEPGHGAKVLVGYRLWQDFFGGDPAILERELRIEGVPHTVIGVMPEDFQFPGWDAQLWLPVTLTPWLKSDDARHSNYFDMLARLRPGATVEQAQSQLDALNASLVDRIPARLRQMVTDAGYASVVRPFHADLIRAVRQPLLLLACGALLVLVIGAVSLANLLLVRSTGRLREMATRYVLGAGGGRLLRQLLTESSVLALAGGTLGLTAAAFVLRLVGVFGAYQVPRVGEIRFDAPATGLLLLAALAVMTAASAVSALAVRRGNLFAVLRTASSTCAPGHLRLRGLLVTAQVAVAVMLAVGAGLLLASLSNLRHVDPGFRAEGLLAGALKLPPAGYPAPPDQHRFLTAVLDELSRIPGVTGAAVASQLPFSGMNEGDAVTPEGYARKPGESVITHVRTAVSPDYFALMGIPLRSGRVFTEADDWNSPRVVVVSEKLARRYWGEDDALGRKLTHGSAPDDDSTWYTVVGVVGDVVHEDLTEPGPRGAYYLPYRQAYMGFTRLVIRAETEPYALLPAVRERVFAIDPEMPVFWTETLEESVAGTLIPVRVPMQLLVVFAAVALGLAAIGVYGVLARSVTERTREISIRMALGSPRADIYRWTLRGMMASVAAGLGVGLAGALSLTHLMQSLLYEVRPRDPAVFMAVAAVIGGVAFLAALGPALRAMRIDPVRALDAQ